MPLNLREKQSKFVKMKALLILYAYQLGYELTDGDAYRDPRVAYGHLQSTHRLRLAQDFNLFKDGKYLVEASDHEPLGLFWESLGGAWGGRFNDGNHYSLEHNGVK